METITIEVKKGTPSRLVLPIVARLLEEGYDEGMGAGYFFKRERTVECQHEFVDSNTADEPDNISMCIHCEEERE